MKEIKPYNEFQMDRLIQLKEGLAGLEDIYNKIENSRSNVAFYGGEDGEKAYDRDTADGIAGGLKGVCRELESEGLGKEVVEIIYGKGEA